MKGDYIMDDAERNWADPPDDDEAGSDDVDEAFDFYDEEVD
jgi:hypothetical protein